MVWDVVVLACEVVVGATRVVVVTGGGAAVCVVAVEAGVTGGAGLGCGRGRL